MLRDRIITEDSEAITEEYFSLELAKCLAKASLDYSVESVYRVKVIVDDQEIPVTVQVKEGWGE